MAQLLDTAIERAAPAGDSGVPHARVAIVGSGFSGLGMAICLKQAGQDDFVVLERSEEVGGTWHDNTYPGCQCDIPSHLYSFSFALNPDWSRTYSRQPEIRAYLRRCAEEHGVMPHIRFGHELLDATWDDELGHWRLETSRGPMTAQFLVAAPGPLNEPSIPSIPGLEGFEGTIFHSARWNHDHDLAGERVAVIGTGASAIQFVPRIQPEVGKLHLFQRTPPWVLPHTDRPTTRLERRLYRRLPFLQRLVRAGIYWTREALVLGLVHDRRLIRLLERAARSHLRRQVPDRGLRRKLRPSYTIGCKRILLSNDYYPALTQPNVEVVTDGIREVRGSSIVTGDGAAREVDTIILGTGFHVTDIPAADRLRGRGGRLLADIWQGSPQAYLGTTVAGFPNMFLLVGPNTGLGHNSIVFMAEAQIRYVMDCLRAMEKRGAHTLEVREEAQAAFNEEVQSRMPGTVWSAGGCASWYIDANGLNTTLWPDFTWRFRRRTRRFDAAAYRVGSRAAEPCGGRRMRPVRPLALLALAGAGSGAAAGWTARRRADLRAIRADPAHAVLEAPLAGRPLPVTAYDGTPLHVEELGPPDAPTVVLVHGWTCALRFWTCQLQALSSDLRVVAYDLRGHGRSGRPARRDYSIDAHAADLEAVLRAALPDGGRAVVAGHSLGAMTLVAWAGRHAAEVRERIAAAALVNTGMGDIIDQSFVLRAPTRVAGARQALGRLLISAQAPLPKGPTPITHRAIRYLALSRSASPAEVAFCERIVLECPRDVRAACGGTLSELDLHEAVESLAIPTAVIAGERDRLTPPSHARRLADTLPHLDAELMIPGAGHMTPVTHPDLVTREIRRLAEQHAPSPLATAA